jgi:hypothetical protein
MKRTHVKFRFAHACHDLVRLFPKESCHTAVTGALRRIPHKREFQHGTLFFIQLLFARLHFLQAQRVRPLGKSPIQCPPAQHGAKAVHVPCDDLHD